MPSGTGRTSCGRRRRRDRDCATRNRYPAGYLFRVPRLRNTKQIARRIGHRRHFFPVLERVRKRLRDRVLDSIDPNGTDQRPAKTGLNEQHELLEPRCINHATTPSHNTNHRARHSRYMKAEDLIKGEAGG